MYERQAYITRQMSSEAGSNVRQVYYGTYRQKLNGDAGRHIDKDRNERIRQVVTHVDRLTSDRRSRTETSLSKSGNGIQGLGSVKSVAEVCLSFRLQGPGTG